MENNKDVLNLANEHWEYTCKVMKLMYIEAFLHGYKHAEEDYVEKIK